MVLLDVRDTDRNGDRVEGVQTVDLIDPDRTAYAHHFEGVDAVIHLGHRGRGGDPLDHFFTEKNNVEMVYNILRTSYDAGVSARRHRQLQPRRGLVRARADPPPEDGDPGPPSGFPCRTTSTAGRRPATSTWGSCSPAAPWASGTPAAGSSTREAFWTPARRWASSTCGSARQGTWTSTYTMATRSGTRGTWGPTSAPGTLRSSSPGPSRRPTSRTRTACPGRWSTASATTPRAFWSLSNAREILGYEPQDDSEVKYADDIRGFLVGSNATGGPGRVG